jgi:hypothetical protein
MGPWRFETAHRAAGRAGRRPSGAEAAGAGGRRPGGPAAGRRPAIGGWRLRGGLLVLAPAAPIANATALQPQGAQGTPAAWAPGRRTWFAGGVADSRTLRLALALALQRQQLQGLARVAQLEALLARLLDCGRRRCGHEGAAGAGRPVEGLDGVGVAHAGRDAHERPGALLVEVAGGADMGARQCQQQRRSERRGPSAGRHAAAGCGGWPRSQPRSSCGDGAGQRRAPSSRCGGCRLGFAYNWPRKINWRRCWRRCAARWTRAAFPDARLALQYRPPPAPGRR